MATMVAVIPPIEILPITFMLELLSGLALFRGGIRDADRKLVTGLVVGTMTGVPIGLAVLRIMGPQTSSAVALTIILTAAVLLLGNVRLRWLDSGPGLGGAGLAAGIATGLASVGGLVIAVYTLSLGRPAAVIRGTLIAFIFVSVGVSALAYTLFGIFTTESFVRAALLAGPVLAGVGIGIRMFSRARETLYRRICLVILITLASAGLLRLTV